jgi:hypothetical protein
LTVLTADERITRQRENRKIESLFIITFFETALFSGEVTPLLSD